MSRHARPSLRGASRRVEHGWVIAAIGGAPYDRGYQHGHLLAPEIREALRVVRFLIYNDTGLPFDWFARNAAAMYEDMLRGNDNGRMKDGFGSEILDELEGIVDGANDARRRTERAVTLADLLCWNAYPELICQWFPAVMAGQITPPVPMPGAAAGAAAAHAAQPVHRRWHHFHHSCSAFVATGRWTADGGIVAAHTTWQRFANGDAYNVILDITPARGHRIVMQSAPGYVHSNTDFWQTAAGLVITETSLNVSGFDPKGIPEFVRVRRASQLARSIPQWCDLFRLGNNGGYVNTWLLADAKRKEIAAFELTLHHDEMQPVLTSGVYAACNIPLSVPVRQLDSSGPAGYDNVLMNAGRRVRFDELLEQARGALDAGLAMRILADHHDVFLRAECPSSRTICGHLDNDSATLGSHAGSPDYPWGSLDGKVTTGALVRKGRFHARWGRACGLPLDTAAFFREHPEYRWMAAVTKDRPPQPWMLVPDRNV